MRDRVQRKSRLRSRGLLVTVVSVLAAVASPGCARLPYTVETIHEDQRVAVRLQQEVQPVAYSHPVQLDEPALTAILNGLSIRPEIAVPMRWFAEEPPPKPLFHPNELRAMVPYLAAALHRVGTTQRVYFEVSAPGPNPVEDRDVIAGWVAVREPYFFISVDYFHTLLPRHKNDLYITSERFATPSPHVGSYVLYFEPGRFWDLDKESGLRGVEFRAFLKSQTSSQLPTGPSSRASP